MITSPLRKFKGFSFPLIRISYPGVVCDSSSTLGGLYRAGLHVQLIEPIRDSEINRLKLKGKKERKNKAGNKIRRTESEFSFERSKEKKIWSRNK